MPAVQASLAASLGSNWRSRVFLWLAWYRLIPGLVSGYDAVQYSDKCLDLNLDCSTVSLRFLSIAQPPYSPPKPKPNYDENFQGGFLRGFTVAWDHRHHRSTPPRTFVPTNQGAYNRGFQVGFRSGWGR
jgi:hypothetical protein